MCKAESIWTGEGFCKELYPKCEHTQLDGVSMPISERIGSLRFVLIDLIY